jgi:rfaE bifunctional protein nucleotidyltransferase chain/domain
MNSLPGKVIGSISKINDLDQLRHRLDSYRSEGKRIVLCHGVFDLLHIGHIRYFEQARRFGDILVVTITPDRHVDKGPGRPAFTETLRAEAIASLSCVDHVAINEWATAEETLRLLKPDFYIKGSEFKNTASDMTGKIAREEAVVREIGATLAFADDIVFSSSHLINRYLSSLPEAIQQYLSFFSQRYAYQQILDILDQMSSLKVLVIGDTILDEYQYVQAMGKSSKDPILAVQYQSHDLFAGGVLAVANHVANFAKHVQLVTVLGERDRQEGFIRSQLRSNISPHFLTQPNAPTLIKRRFIDGYTFNKLFEVYVMDDRGLPAEEEDDVCKWLKEELPKYDVVIAADFGNGAISAKMARSLAEGEKFLAVSTQANAGNRGFHTVTRYPRADFVCLAEHEMRLEMRDLTGDLSPMMLELSGKLGCRRFIVTSGRKGCRMMGRNGTFLEVPSFTEKVVDRVGAGDAFYSVTSLAAALDAPDEVIAFIGNMAGSLAVEILGNQKSIDKMAMKKYAVSLLK